MNDDGAPGAADGVALPPTAFAELRDHLLTHSVRRGDFVLKSGKRSRWFIDSKQTVCRPEAMLLVADAVLSVVPDDATAIGGLTMGADPVAFVTAGVAATRGRSLKAFSVRKEAKDHGGGGRIAGALDPGDRGRGDRGHRDPWHVAARGGARRAGGRGRAGPAGGRRRPRRHGGGDGGRGGLAVPGGAHRARTSASPTRAADRLVAAWPQPYGRLTGHGARGRGNG